MIFIHHHLREGLKTEYLTVKDPLELWINPKDRYDHLQLMVLPKARYEWIYLRFQDYKTVAEYNSVVHKVNSILKLCGDTMMTYLRKFSPLFTLQMCCYNNYIMKRGLRNILN